MPANAFDLEEDINATEGDSADSFWPDPEPIPDTLRPVPPMAPEMLPEAFKAWIADVADRMQCPLDFPAVAAVVAVGAVIGTAIRIRPKRRDDWTVTPNLWGAVVGDPSSLKSPALMEALAPLQRLEIRAKEEYEAALQDHEFDLMAAKARKEAIRKRLAEAAKGKKDTEAIRADYLAEEEPDEPTRRRYIVNDPTVEAIGVRLNENPRGVLLYRDELPGWLRKFDKPGQESDRAFYLEAWNGSGRYTYDRIERGTLDIESTCVSILGGIQPGPLQAYLDAAREGGYGNDGFIQRFQLMVYPDPKRDWHTIDRYPDAAAKDRAFRVFETLASREPGMVADRDGDDGPHFLRFDDAAQEFFYEWHADTMRRCRELGGTAMGSHLAKYPKLMPALALIFHLVAVADGTASGPVSLDAAETAAAWCAYLEAHADRLYGAVGDSGYNRARELVKHIKAGDLSSPFTARMVRLKGWQLLGEPEHVQEALDVAEEFVWVAKQARATKAVGGRPTVDYLINPKATEGGQV